jgi:hypothetical protein
MGFAFPNKPSLSVLLYPVLALVAFFPCLVGGNAFFDGDLYAQHIPMREYLRENLLQGRFPLWCPLLLGGQPFFADPNVMAAYPLTYPSLIFPVPYGFGVFYFIHLVLAAFGMDFWLKTLGLSESSRRVGAVLFALSGFFWWEIIHPPLLAAYAWMPWWGGALERVAQKLKLAWAFLAGLVFAFLFLASSFQMTMAALYGGGIYLAFRLFAQKDWKKGPRTGKQLLLAIIFFFWGSLPILTLWIPAKEFLDLSARLHSIPDYETFLADYSLNPAHVSRFLFPVKPFKPDAGAALPTADYLANAGYLGPWAFFLMALALRRLKNKFTYFLAAVAVLALLLSFGKYFPMHRIFCLLAPGFELMRAPFRYVFLYAIAGSLLAAFGFEALKQKIGTRPEKSGPGMLIQMALYASAVAGLAWWSGGEILPQLMGLVLGFMAFCLWIGAKTCARAAQWFFIASLSLSLLWTGWNTSPSRLGPADNLNYASRSDVPQKLKERMGLARVFIGGKIPYPVQSEKRTIQLDLPPDVAYVTGFRNAGGYNPLFLNKVSELYTLPPKTFVQLMAVQAFVTGGKEWENAGYPREDWGPVKFYNNPGKVLFAYAPGLVKVIPDDRQRLTAMQDSRFKPYEESFFSESPPRFNADGKKTDLKFMLSRDDPDEQVFQVDLNRPGCVVFSEVMYPGWKARMDGAPCPLFTANHAFRAVWVPSGRHEIRFAYKPSWWKPITYGLILWFLSVLVLCLGPWRRNFWNSFN